MKVALSTINHQYHIICMQNIYDNQFHCNISSELFNFTFQRSTNDQSQHIMQLQSSFEVHIQICQSRAIVFLMVFLRYHTVLWVDKSEYLPDDGIQVLLFFSTVATHILYETSHCFWRKYQYHQSRQFVIFYVPNHKKLYQSDNLFHISFKEKWKRLSGLYYKIIFLPSNILALFLSLHLGIIIFFPLVSRDHC